MKHAALLGVTTVLAIVSNAYAAQTDETISLRKDAQPTTQISTSLVSAIRLSGHIGAEHRYFSQTPLHLEQEANQTSLFGEVEFYWQSPGGNDSVTITPFARKDFTDDNRSHVELKEGFWLHLDGNTELSIGSKIVFWGVTESRHLVDIINQTDSIESPDFEDKLGQPMVQFTWIKDWGSVELFALPYFRQPLYASEQGRLRLPFQVSEHPLYQSSKEQSHHDFALRASQSLGDWDLGISAFKGTARDAEFIPVVSNNNVIDVLRPYHRQISQFSVDVQATIDDMLWKFEAIYLKQKALDSPLINAGLLTPSDSYFAATTGFEYTIVGFNDSDSDLGLLFEYNYDQQPNSLFSDTAFIATRWAFNDFSSSEILAGINIDPGNNDHSALIEANTRFGDNIKISFEARWFDSSDQLSPLYLLRRDDFIELDVRYYF